MYYENFELLCKEKGVRPSTVSKETGISTATLTSWKQGKYTPKPNKLELIANYFHVPVDYLIAGKNASITIEMARRDLMLTQANDRLKAYFLKLAELPEEKQNHIMGLIDLLEDKKGE